jgi:hypothetical protein
MKGFFMKTVIRVLALMIVLATSAFSQTDYSPSIRKAVDGGNDSSTYMTVGNVTKIPGFGGWVQIKRDDGFLLMGLISPMREIKPGSELKGHVAIIGDSLIFTEKEIHPVHYLLRPLHVRLKVETRKLQLPDCWPGWGEKMEKMKEK